VLRYRGGRGRQIAAKAGAAAGGGGESENFTDAVARWTASSLALGAGDQLPAWPNLVAANPTLELAQPTGGSQPTYQPNIFNDQPGLRFFDKFMTLPDGILVPFFPDTIEAYLVIKIDNYPPGNSDTSGLWIAGAGDASHYSFSDGNIYEAFGSTSRKPAFNPGMSLAVPRVYNIVSSTVGWKARLDGVTVANEGPTFGIFNQFWLGRSTNAYYLRGYVGELTFFSVERTALQRAAINAELAALYQ
jgi:hypothetical protein